MGMKAEHRELEEPGVDPGPAGRGHRDIEGGHPLSASHLRLPGHQGRCGREDPVGRLGPRLDRRDPGHPY